MTLAEYCKYIRNPLAEAKMRVVTVRPAESWTALRRLYQERGDVEVRLSDLVRESAWLPMPDEVFERVWDATTTQVANGKSVVLLGMSGYLALLTDENKRAAVSALREWVDGASGRDSVCLLRGDYGTKTVLKEVFVNPRYRQGKQLIEIDPDPVGPQSASIRSIRSADSPEPWGGSQGRTEVMLVGADLAAYIPEACDTFQKYLRHTEEHPHDNSSRRIVVASEGRELAGLSAEVRQIVSLRDFARVFYRVDDAALSEDALRWLCGRGKEGAEENLAETLRGCSFQEVKSQSACCACLTHARVRNAKRFIGCSSRWHPAEVTLSMSRSKKGLPLATSGRHTWLALRIAWMMRWYSLWNAGMPYRERTQSYPASISSCSLRVAKGNPRRGSPRG